jgi:hypothetical protein
VRYEVRTVERDRMLDVEGGDRDRNRLDPGVVETFITVDATPRGATWELTGAVTFAVRSGKYRPWTVADPSYAHVILVTDGRRFSENDGPTALFDQLGTQGGLALLFPTIPASAAVGAETDWEIAFPTTAGILTTERTRGRLSAVDGGLPPTPPETARPALRAKVRFEGWSGAANSRVARLTMTGTYPTDAVQEFDAGATSIRINTRARSDFRARYSILESGRLLDAHIERTTHIEMTGTAPQKHEQTQVTDAHLVAACDGPTAPPLGVPLSREERAIAGDGEFIAAVGRGDRTAALALVAPALRKAHGDDRLWTTLTRFFATRGPHALQPPVFIHDEDVTVLGERVRIQVQGSTPKAGEPNTRTPVTGAIELAEIDGAFRVASLELSLLFEKASILQITPTVLTP